MTIEPSARVNWHQLINIESIIITESPDATVAPFMPTPSGHQLNPQQDSEQPADALLTPRFQSSASAPKVTLSFQALGDNGTTIPPDTHGAAGPNHLMTMLNSQVRIQDRSGTTISTVGLSTFWSPAGASGVFDPRILYDQGSSRWLAACDSDKQSSSSSVLFAISDTNDPTGTWTFYKIKADNNSLNWADFPDIGFNNTWIAITNNMFAVAGNVFANTSMWIIDKSTALAGGSLTITTFNSGFDKAGVGFGSALRVCHTFGSEATLYIIDNHGFKSGPNNLLRLSQITGTASSPSWSPLAGGPSPGTGFFVVANNFRTSQIDAEQLGTSGLIATNDHRMINAVFRNGSIWCTHSGGLPAETTADRTAVFWYQIDPTAIATGPIVQSGVIDEGPGNHLMYPSIAANANDDAFIGCSRTSSTRFVEAVYTGRLSTDVLGSMDTLSVLKAGEDSYLKDLGTGSIRWGDYSATVVDPVDDLGFWTIQEYAALDLGGATSQDQWGTWWGNAPFVECCINTVGNIDNDNLNVVNIADLTFLIDHLFISLVNLPCPKEANIDNDMAGAINIADLNFLIDHLFLTLPPLPSCQ